MFCLFDYSIAKKSISFKFNFELEGKISLSSFVDEFKLVEVVLPKPI